MKDQNVYIPYCFPDTPYPFLNPRGIGRDPSTCSGWKGANSWKLALRAGTVLIPLILNHSIRRIHSMRSIISFYSLRSWSLVLGIWFLLVALRLTLYSFVVARFIGQCLINQTTTAGCPTLFALRSTPYALGSYNCNRMIWYKS